MKKSAITKEDIMQRLELLESEKTTLLKYLETEYGEDVSTLTIDNTEEDPESQEEEVYDLTPQFDKEILGWLQEGGDPLSHIKTKKQIIAFANFVMRYSHYEYAEDSNVYIAEGAFLKCCLIILKKFFKDSFTFDVLHDLLAMTNYIQDMDDMHREFDENYEVPFEVLYRDIVNENKGNVADMEHYYMIAVNVTEVPMYVLSNHLIDRLDDVMMRFSKDDVEDENDIIPENLFDAMELRNRSKKDKNKKRVVTASTEKDNKCVVKRTESNEYLFLPVM